ncbi:MAG: hypothetical protein B7Z66_03830 [Chromatiales bacterium 21-64-14]|nr:MAG: hypothetical protein B7Z66_03830 [Chromatiales bacterium 21-64-14]HQU14791.1 DUF4124 domain-containing protein [Gammaproteobacteria bacterium]
MRENTGLSRVATVVGLLAAALFAPHASAAIYKWTDPSGVIHYSQTPPPEGQAKHFEELAPSGLTAPPPDPGTAADTQTQGKAQKTAAKTKAKEKPKGKEKPPEDPAARAAHCKKAQETLTLLETHPRVNLHEAGGKVTHLTEEQRQARIDSLRKDVAKECQGP